MLSQAGETTVADSVAVVDVSASGAPDIAAAASNEVPVEAQVEAAPAQAHL